MKLFMAFVVRTTVSNLTKKSGEGNKSATVAVWAPAGHDGVHVWLV